MYNYYLNIFYTLFESAAMINRNATEISLSAVVAVYNVAIPSLTAQSLFLMTNNFISLQ
jgi:hypothetical protein